MFAPETEITASHDGQVLFRRIVTPGDYVIGREEGTDLRVDVPLVSRQHAKLTVDYHEMFIEDLGSSNGTFVNGEPIKKITRIWPSQKLQIGESILETRRINTQSAQSLPPETAAVRGLLPEDLIGEHKYEIGKVVAQGGMGAILNARDAAISRSVAMKVMLQNGSRDDAVRFVEEAKITGQLEHPNIVPVHELAIDEHGHPYYTMKLVQGITLKKVLELLKKGVSETVAKYSLAALLTVFQKMCDAVAFAHSKGVIHRDLKPENIMLGDYGEVLVMDWGLAKVLGKHQPVSAVEGQSNLSKRTEDTGSMTVAGTIMGTPQYMSPEQARGEVQELDARSDIYSLGLILFHLLFLKPPYTGKSAGLIVDKVQRGEVEWLDALVAAKSPRSIVPESLVAVVRKALALERDQRYQNVEELQADLTAYQNGFATSAENAGLGRHLLLALKRHKAASMGVAAVLLVSSVLGTEAFVEGHRATRALTELKRTAPTMLALAENESAFQRFDSALEKLDAAIVLDPTLAEAHWQRAWVLLGQQRWAEAAQAIRRAQQADPANSERGRILPEVERLASKGSVQREGSAEARTVVAALQSVAANGPATALVTNLKLGRDAALALVRQRLFDWLGPKAAERASLGYLGYPGLAVVLSKLPITSIESIAGLPVENLWLDETKVSSLESLKGMPLHRLDIRSTAVTDLHPLSRLPIDELYASRTQITDLSPLQGTPITVLDIGITPVTDFTPLSGMKLRILGVAMTKVRDLRFLTGMPLQNLSLEGTDITDLSALHSLPLQILYLKDTRVSDISPLRGLPLRELDLHSCSAAIDLGVIVDLPDLEKLVVSDKNPTIEKLRHHPKLRLIQYLHTGGGRQPTDYQPIEEFWKEYDAKKSGGK